MTKIEIKKNENGTYTINYDGDVLMQNVPANCCLYTINFAVGLYDMENFVRPDGGLEYERVMNLLNSIVERL